MNIKLSVNLQLPKECESYSKEELQQLLSDAVVHYAAVSHRADAVKWSTPQARLQHSCTQDLVDYHNLWGDICSAATFEIENVEK
jgi:hypothetical protein